MKAKPKSKAKPAKGRNSWASKSEAEKQAVLDRLAAARAARQGKSKR